MRLGDPGQGIARFDFVSSRVPLAAAPVAPVGGIEAVPATLRAPPAAPAAGIGTLIACPTFNFFGSRFGFDFINAPTVMPFLLAMPVKVSPF